MNYEEALKKRWKARTDLLWLCNNLLDMNKVTEELNGEMIRRMYHFPKPQTFEQMKQHDYWDKQSGWNYTPLIVDPLRMPGKLPDPIRMPGKRRTLLLDSRGFYKTSLNVIAHTVQWILNYPDITVLIFQGTLPMAKQFLCETKNHFHVNDKMRELFPELCAPYEDDFGSEEDFTIPGRSKGYLREQPTMKATSILQPGAGQHVEVIKCSDIVNEENSNTKEMCEKITDRFYISHNRLVGLNYWIDVEGTRYNHSDCYGSIIEDEKDTQKVYRVWVVNNVPYLRKTEADRVAEETKGRIREERDYYVPQPEKRDYNVYINICYKLKDAATRKYDYDDMMENLETHWARDEFNRPMSRSPIDWPAEKLEAERKRSKYLFACQKLNNPNAESGADIKFPVDNQYPRLIKRDVYRQNVRIAYFDVVVDTANTVSRRSDFSCIIPAGFDSGGRVYVPEIVHGKFHEEEVADKIIDVCRRYRPRRLLIEKDRGSTGIRVWLKRHMQLHGENFSIHDLPILNQTSKVDKIAETLRPWYVSGDLVFLDDIGIPLEAFKNECRRFPRGHDDILDALSGLFYGKPWLGRNFGRPDPTAGEPAQARSKALVMEDFKRHIGIQDTLGDESSGPEYLDSYSRITGSL